MFDLRSGLRRRRLACAAVALLAATQEAQFQQEVGPVVPKMPQNKAYCGRNASFGNTVWAQMLSRMRCRRALQVVPTPQDCADELNFRRRFRVSFEGFLKILDIVKDYGPSHATDAVGNPACPLDIRVLGVLRILGRGWLFDDLEEVCTHARTHAHTHAQTLIKEMINTL
jgi:hypothetical protein